jgi:hypothetical protein
MSLRIIALGGAYAILTVGAGQAQTRGPTHTTIPDRVTCSACSIETTRVVTLGDTSGPGYIESHAAQVIADSRGRFIVSGSRHPTIKVFSPEGRFLTSFGRRGQGPGEYENISFVLVAASDTLYVADARLRRVTVLSPEYKYVRSVSVEISPAGRNLFLLPGGELLNASPDRTPDRIGLPIHVIGRDGKVVRSFGSQTGLFRPDIPLIDRRTLTMGDETQVWAGYLMQYVIELWDASTGRMLRSLSRDVDWFPPQLTSRTNRLSETPPAPALQALHLDAQGRLWTVVGTADRNWRTGIRVNPSAAGDPDHVNDIEVIDRDRYIDTYIEVIDPVAGRLIASRRFDKEYWFFLRDGRILKPTFTTDGVPQIEIWSVELRDRRSGQ